MRPCIIAPKIADKPNYGPSNLHAEPHGEIAFACLCESGYREFGNQFVRDYHGWAPTIQNKGRAIRTSIGCEFRTDNPCGYYAAIVAK